MTRSIKLLLICMVLCIPLLCSGCWDSRDVTELSIVTAVGIDKNQNGQYEFTVQIVKPSAISAKAQGSMEEAVWTLTKDGDTIFQAVRNLLSAVGQRPLYSHTELMVIGQGVAIEGLEDVFDFFERDHETRRRAYVLIAKGMTAKDVINAKSDRTSIPAMHISAILQTASGLPEKRKIELINLLKELSSPGREAVVGVIHPVAELSYPIRIKDLDVSGAAVFKADRLTGWLEPHQTRGYEFVVNEVQSGLMNISNPKSPGDLVSIEIKQAKSQMSVAFNQEEPTLKIDMKVEGNIGEQQGEGDLTTNEMIYELEQEYQQAVLSEVSNIVWLAQNDLGCDIFGFGEIVHRKNPEYWSSVKDDWNTVFASLPVEIQVEAVIRKPGLVKYPVEPK